MSTKHDTLFASTGRITMLDQFGDAVAYQVPGQAAFSCIAQMSPEEQVEVEDDRGRKTVTERTVTFSYAIADPINQALSSNTTQHQVIIAGDVWSDLKIIQRTGSMAAVRVRLSKRLQFERAGTVAKP